MNKNKLTHKLTHKPIRIITCIDTETTGLSHTADHIIQISLVNFNIDTMEEVKKINYYILPNCAFEISKSAEEVHGISKDFLLKNGKYLTDVADEILSMINESDAFLTYNGNTFDFKFLVKDFKEVGYNFPINKPCFDSYAIECKLNPRDLSSVYKKYVGHVFEGAHDSLCDVHATMAVFKKQCEYLETQNINLDNLVEWRENQLLDPDGFIRDASTTDASRLIFTTGKYKNCEIYDVMKKDPSYISWWANTVASDYTKDIVRRYLKNLKNLKNT